MSLQTPTSILARQWKLISQGEDTSRAGVSSLDTSIKRPTIVGLVVKPIGKPSAGNRHARFDERCALQVRTTQPSEMAAATKPSEQSRTESCVASGNGRCEA